MSDELESGRRLARRRMGWISFCFVIGSGVAIMSTLMLSPDAMATAEALKAASSVLGLILGFATTVTLAYLGVSLAERVATKKEG